MREIGLLYFMPVNILAFAVSVFDKRAAMKKRRRIPENSLFVLAAAGGAPGLYVSMLLFRHKTRHKRFMFGVPAIFAAQIAATMVIWWIINR